MSRTRRRHGFGGALVVALLASAALAAPPLAPEEVSYQGLLLDGAGAPRTGNVDLTARIFDALNGGTLLYTQVFLAVPLSDGVFTVSLGPSGAISDSPVDPLTTSLAEALVADLGATGPDRFLELTVGTEIALTRTQILAVPYALHATTADQATTADSATTATTADDTAAVGGLDSLFVTQLYEQTNLDFEDPPNTDPLEGLADVDGDGASNFIDPDNDGDGLLDGTELANGTALNLVTPTLAAVAPPNGDADLTGTVTLTGTSFEPGMSVDFGSESPAPANLSATSLEVEVGPQAPGFVDVTVTRLNGESATLPAAFEFVKIEPTITGFDPPLGSVTGPTPITISGTNFQPDMTIVFGSETAALGNVTPTSVDVVVGPQTGTVDVTVSLVNGNSFTTPYEFSIAGLLLSHPVTPGGQLTFDVKGSQQTILGTRFEYGVDTDADLVPETILPFATRPVGQLAVAWSPAGDVTGLRCRETGPANECAVEVAVDSDADFELEDEVGTVIETVSGPGVRTESTSLAFDASGNVGAGYLTTRVGSVMAQVAHDRDGNGDFLGTNERVTIESLAGMNASVGEVAFDAAGRIAYVYRKDLDVMRVAYDRSGDGDFDDVVGGSPELFDLASGGGGTFSCVGVAFDSAGGLAIAYGGSGNPLELARDLDQDGDFDGPGERETLTGFDVLACDVVGGAGLGLAVTHDESGSLRLLVDRDDDGDFLGPDESLGIATSTPPDVVELRRNDSGQVVLATDSGVFRDTVP